MLGNTTSAQELVNECVNETTSDSRERNLDTEEPYAGNWLVRICGGAGCHSRDAQLYPEK